MRRRPVAEQGNDAAMPVDLDVAVTEVLELGRQPLRHGAHSPERLGVPTGSRANSTSSRSAPDSAASSVVVTHPCARRLHRRRAGSRRGMQEQPEVRLRDNERRREEQRRLLAVVAISAPASRARAATRLASGSPSSPRHWRQSGPLQLHRPVDPLARRRAEVGDDRRDLDGMAAEGAGSDLPRHGGAGSVAGIYAASMPVFVVENGA